MVLAAPAHHCEMAVCCLVSTVVFSVRGQVLKGEAGAGGGGAKPVPDS